MNRKRAFSKYMKKAFLYKVFVTMFLKMLELNEDIKWGLYEIDVQTLGQ